MRAPVLLAVTVKQTTLNLLPVKIVPKVQPVLVELVPHVLRENNRLKQQKARATTALLGNGPMLPLPLLKMVALLVLLVKKMLPRVLKPNCLRVHFARTGKLLSPRVLMPALIVPKVPLVLGELVPLVLPENNR